MKKERLIQELQKIPGNPEIKMHSKDGYNLLFVLQIVGHDDVAFLEDATDNDLGEELEARFTHAAEVQLDELDFFTDLLEIGYTLEDIKNYIPDRYEYSKNFMEEHGLV